MDIILKKRVRINLEIDSDVREAMAELQQKSGATSVTEVIRRALAVYDLITDHTMHGGKLILRNSDGEDEQLRIL